MPSPHFVKPPAPVTSPLNVVLPAPPKPVAESLIVTVPATLAVAVVLELTRAPLLPMPLDDSDRGSATPAWPLRSSTPPAVTVVPAVAEPRAVALPTWSVPEPTVVGPL